jgi:hypothetical protein
LRATQSFNLKGARMSNDSKPRPHLIVTVHGIRTFGQWQERLEQLVCGDGNAEIEFVNYKYGYFSVVAFVIPFFRWLVVRRFRRELVKLCAHTSRSRIDLVGHSFGTHIIAWSIARLPAEHNLFIDTVLLSGSVLRAGFPWRDLISKRVGRVVNDCGTRDNVLLLSQFFVLFTGMAGRTGFSGLMSDGFRNRYSIFGHSGYFQDKRSRPCDLYMKQNWLPLLLGDGRIAEFDHREANIFDGFVAVLANNIEPIKLTMYIAPFIVLLWWILGLYLNAETQRLEAERQRNQAEIARFDAEQKTRRAIAFQLATQSSAILSSSAQRAVLLAAEALKITEAMNESRVPAAEKALRDALANHGGHALRAHEGSNWLVAVSPDGRWAVTGGRDPIAYLYDLRRLDQPPWELHHSIWALEAKFSADSRWLATGT